MIQNNNSNTNVIEKRGRGRPSKSYEVKPKSHEFVECVNCFRIFDLNANYRSLDQAIIDDKKFCPSCFDSEIMNKQYADQNDIISDYCKL